MSEWTQNAITTVGSQLTVTTGGSGKPLLVLHEELGDPGWLKWKQELAKSHTVITPQHPGFGVSPRIDWARSINDLANFYAQVLVEQGWVGCDVIGFSLGGWIAAEMAAQNPAQFSSMTLVAPTGIKPPEGEIADIYYHTNEKYLALSIDSPEATPEFTKMFGGELTAEQFERFQDATAETARLAWQPYMNNPALTHRLGLIKALPTLILWGNNDRIVPASAGEVFRHAIAGSKLVVLDDCGHRPEIEQTDKFLAEVTAILS
jgi:pimeloyl-ACP methyl ester carboxylesterase